MFRLIELRWLTDSIWHGLQQEYILYELPNPSSDSKHLRKIACCASGWREDFPPPPAQLLFGNTRQWQEGLWRWIQNVVLWSCGHLHGPVKCNELGSGVVGTSLGGLHDGEIFGVHAAWPFFSFDPFWPLLCKSQLVLHFYNCKTKSGQTATHYSGLV